MASRRRICLFITRLDLGGAQQIVLDLAQHLDRSRFDVTLVAGSGGRLDDEARALPHTTVKLVPWLRHAISPRDPLAGLRLARFFRQERFDIVHTHSSKAGAVGRLAARMAKVPRIVHTVHGWSFNDSQTMSQRRAYIEIERACAHLCHALICVSDRDRERGLGLGIGRPDQYRILRAGIDTALELDEAGARAVRRALGWPEDAPVVGTIANLKPQKAPLDVAKVAAAVLRARPEVRFFLAGGGPLRAEVEQYCAREGIADRVALLGWRDDVPALLTLCDVFLLMSHFEGLPRSVLQAMAARVPVVATAVDGTAEVVTQQTGWPVDKGDIQGGARAVLEALDGDDERVGNAHAQLPAFSLPAMRAGHEALYVEE